MCQINTTTLLKSHNVVKKFYVTPDHIPRIDVLSFCTDPTRWEKSDHMEKKFYAVNHCKYELVTEIYVI